MNTFGEKLRLTTFGESHGPAIGGVIDGFPSLVKVDFEFLNQRMKERKPGRKGTSPRREEDEPEFLSGISEEGVTLGTPIGFIIHNRDARPEDYSRQQDTFRPNHADYTYQMKYGIRALSGGGRASARETACRVLAGSLAEQWLGTLGITIEARLAQVGTVSGTLEEMMAEAERVRLIPDSVGGRVECSILNMPPGIGEPLYDKLSARLAYAMMSINAAKGFEIGDGFDMAASLGSEVRDDFYQTRDGETKIRSNHCGGILGGISTGQPVKFNVAFKPTPTVTGRHDPCVAIRAVPVVRAMAALVAADLILQNRSLPPSPR